MRYHWMKLDVLMIDTSFRLLPPDALFDFGAEVMFLERSPIHRGKSNTKAASGQMVDFKKGLDSPAHLKDHNRTHRSERVVAKWTLMSRNGLAVDIVALGQAQLSVSPIKRMKIRLSLLANGLLLNQKRANNISFAVRSLSNRRKEIIDGNSPDDSCRQRDLHRDRNADKQAFRALVLASGAHFLALANLYLFTPLKNPPRCAVSEMTATPSSSMGIR